MQFLCFQREIIHGIQNSLFFWAVHNGRDRRLLLFVRILLTQHEVVKGWQNTTHGPYLAHQLIGFSPWAGSSAGSCVVLGGQGCFKHAGCSPSLGQGCTSMEVEARTCLQLLYAPHLPPPPPKFRSSSYPNAAGSFLARVLCAGWQEGGMLQLQESSASTLVAACSCSMAPPCPCPNPEDAGHVWAVDTASSCWVQTQVWSGVH